MIGYARVSTEGQSLNRQVKLLKDYGCVEIVKEIKSGIDLFSRDKMIELLKSIPEGATLVVDQVDRLGRNYYDVEYILNKLSEKDVELIVLALPNATIQEVLFFAKMSEVEFLENKRRQQQGIDMARIQGFYKGKPFEYLPDAKNESKRNIYFNVVEGLKNNESISKLAKDNNITRQTVYNIKKRAGLN